MRYFTFGVGCRLGYGYNAQLDRFVKVNVGLQRIKREKMDSTEIGNVLSLTNDQLIKFHLGRYLEESTLRILDFYIINDFKKYWRFMLLVYTCKETCDNINLYPENCDYHVVGLEYGIHMIVIVPQEYFPEEENEMETLLASTLTDVNKLSTIQKQQKCRVLINTKETKEMTMEELFKFKDELKNGEHAEYEEVIAAEVKKHKDLKHITVKDEELLKNFLTYLYTCYRKIEMKYKNICYCLYEGNNVDYLSIRRICTELETVKRSYKMIHKGNLTKMYTTMKELFWINIKYLRISIDNAFQIDEGENLPGEWQDICSWLVKLDHFMRVKINGKWYEATLENYVDPELHLKGQRDAVFGFVDMKGPFEVSDGREKTSILIYQCPLKCSNDYRKWICSNCSDIIKWNDCYIHCSCGKKLHNEVTFTCNHPEHELTVVAQKLPKDLRIIVQQLKKYEKLGTKNPESDRIIKESKRRIVCEYPSTDIRTIIDRLRKLDVFDGDTEHVLNQYLMRD